MCVIMPKIKQADKIKEIKKIIGKPYFESQNVLLYNIDCLKLMDKLGRSVIDLTITSPPYNIGKEYESIMKVEQYVNWSERWMKYLYNITKKNGSFWLNLGYFKVLGKGCAVPIPYLIWNKSSFYFLQEIVWHYGAGVATKKLLSPRNEKFLWYVKNQEKYIFNLDAIRDKMVQYPNQKKNGRLKVNPKGKNPTNVWSIPKVTSGNGRASKERTKHPSQSPLQVIDRIVKACSKKHHVVFDPFIGSGTVAVAALNNDRLVIGCDINKKYLNIAKNRIKQSQYSRK